MSALLPKPRCTVWCLAAGSLLAALAFSTPGPLSAQANPVIAEAEEALAEGHAFRATRLLAPLLGSRAAKDPALILLAARAAAGWEGWGAVARLLGPETWLDTLAAGEGRALLARARVERGDAALDDARRAVAGASGDDLAPRLITLARAFDRANLLDSAAAAYARAADLLPALADWLRLRAAGVESDSSRRATLYRGIALQAAAARVPWTEALARDRSGDWREAARRYAALGAALTSMRVRIRAAVDTAARRELLGLLPRLSADEARDATLLLDQAFPTLTPAEELVVARRATGSDPRRAVAGYARATRARPLAESDRFGYATMLARLGRHREAMTLFAGIQNRALRPQAQFQSARSLIATGEARAALAALRRLAQSFQGDSATGATAAFRVADLLVDLGDERGARRAYLEVARRFPGNSQASRAALQAALLAWVAGDRGTAGREFAALAERAGSRLEGIAALYWTGRALAARGDSSGAAARWRELLTRFPTSYYTVPAAQRLGVPPVAEPPMAVSAAPDSGLGNALERGARLERLGLKVEARFEYERLTRLAESNPETLLTTARAFQDHGLTARGYRLALRAPEAASLWLAFPLPASEALEEARQARVNPWLVAALIRQESAFDPMARSVADARGLMQVLPGTGAGMAPAAGIVEWDPALLYQPDLNAWFGIRHLAVTLARFPRLMAALAAYNAGERQANKWMALPGAEDPDVFIERVGFTETRDYLRRILRNLAVYRAYYPVLP